MKLSFVLLLQTIIAGQVGCYLVAPPGPPAPGSDPGCTMWFQDSYGLNCSIVEQYYGLTESQFEAWNPSTTDAGSACHMVKKLYYCVQVNYSSMSIHSISPPTSSTTGHPPTSKVTLETPPPTQNSMLSSTIPQGGTGQASTHSSTQTTVVVQTSSTLITNVQTTGTTKATTPSATTTGATKTTTANGNGVTTPTPYQPGMTTSCRSFHLVVSGDTCSAIASAASISLGQFYSWNPAVGNSCASLYLNYYVCVAIIAPDSSSPGATTSTAQSPSPTTSANGVATPTPYQSGMSASCRTFHLVTSGDTCYAIAQAAGISLNDFYGWNPSVGSSCGSLWQGYYVCISQITSK
ncbi:carbohydrate-binding module family 50 protein [Dissoconium aciculare CBS 342.82]|uniref:Carbohydrate-binding module family 50 protein n=1 Tax=Dissoconium aciculare CBS 342.82 TaxID=1314786 RepID=A0A6J3LUH8_9PEZI|nr:carbohydrate-binding module family 50 protein [Dissoconium aciculare CBS 342.82]KAF1819303.1 carbohydrate-binding module family 50 protein [Dissoconium aciculare CBS 342.82]